MARTLHNRRGEWSILLVLLLVIVCLNGSELLAQGCAMCKTAAAAQSKQAAASLNIGILFLLIPPVAIMSSLLIFAFRRRNSPHLIQEAGHTARGNDDVTSTAA